MMAVCFPRWNSRTGRHKTCWDGDDIYIYWLPFIDRKTWAWWKVRINMIMSYFNHLIRSSIPWSYQWRTLTLACNICCYSVNCFVLTVTCQLPINITMSGFSEFFLSTIRWCRRCQERGGREWGVPAYVWHKCHLFVGRPVLTVALQLDKK